MSEIDEMRAEFYRRLLPVRCRLHARKYLAAVERVVPVATIFCVGLCAGRFATGYPSIWIVAGVALAPLVAAAVWGSTRPIDWSAAAKAVDQHYELADRTLTALANFQQFDLNLHLPAIAELQVRDAVSHLEPVQARRVIELRMSHMGAVLLTGWVLALAAAVLISPERLAGGPAASNSRPGPRVASQPTVVPSPFADLPTGMLTQPARVGQPAGPLAAKERQQDSYLGDNAAAGRYFELLDRKSPPPQRPR